MVEIQAEPQAVLDSIKEREFLRHFQQCGGRWDHYMNSEAQYFERETFNYGKPKIVTLPQSENFWLAPRIK
jgi:hypothetical protein